METWDDMKEKVERGELQPPRNGIIFTGSGV